MKKALITGGTGCLGRNLIDVLENDGWEIIVFHRKSSDLSKLNGCRVKTVVVDFYDKASVENAIPEGTDVIFHIAANLSHDPSDEKDQWRDNVLCTRYLAEGAIQKKVKRFIFTSTGATNRYNALGAEACPKIKSGYIRTKRLAELELYKLITSKLDFVVLHPIIVIGKYDYQNYSTIFQMLKTGKLSRIFGGNVTFCDAEQIAKAHLSAYYNGKNSEHYVLGGVFSSWVELSNTAARILKLKPNVKAVPFPILKLASYFIYFYSKLVGKKPHLTPQIVDLVGQDHYDLNAYLTNKAKTDLGYHIEHQSIEKMVGSCLDWMKLAGKI